METSLDSDASTDVKEEQPAEVICPKKPRDHEREAVEQASQKEWRDEFRRDYGRILHSHGFRRLRNKTQLFPLNELDFFRTRLTHSLEVAQIAKCIALKLNSENDADINTDLVECAGLAHDIGHPPFGHVGERALHEKMQDDGGFEGNAQTLRLLARLEKKVGNEGLNLTFRTLASVLKQCEMIPPRQVGAKKKKGYYASEDGLVEKIRSAVLDGNNDLMMEDKKAFRTRECSIMDIADDIAYATYDLEDSFKGGFLNAMDMIACSDEMAKVVAEKISHDHETPDKYRSCTPAKVQQTLRELAFLDNGLPLRLEIQEDENVKTEETEKEKYNETPKSKKKPRRKKNPLHVTPELADLQRSVQLYKAARDLAQRSDLRTAYTSTLIGRFIDQVSYSAHPVQAAMSTVKLSESTHFEVLVIKYFTYQQVINSPKIQLRETNAYNIITKMFDLLWADTGGNNLPLDYRKKYQTARQWEAELAKETEKGKEKEAKDMLQAARAEAKRVLCDFIAGMTDSYAVEFYGRLTSLAPTTIFKDF